LGFSLLAARSSERGADAAARADGAEDVGPLIAGIAYRARPAAAPRPQPGQSSLLSDASFVLKPDLDGLAHRCGRQRIGDYRGEVFLNASWAASSVLGWCGRADRRVKPRFLSIRPTWRSDIVTSNVCAMTL
jgi:hypothetical protein